MAHSKPAACAAIPTGLHSRPVNKVAARVAFFPGENWEPTLPVGNGSVFDEPPMARPKQNIDKYAHVTGMRRGRLVAVSFFAVNRNFKTIWLMRCDCGRYAFRFIKGWSRRVGVFDQCIACETVNAITQSNPSRATHGIRSARWIAKMLGAGFTKVQCQLIQQYKLPTEDAVWLKGALAEIELRLIETGSNA